MNVEEYVTAKELDAIDKLCCQVPKEWAEDGDALRELKRKAFVSKLDRCEETKTLVAKGILKKVLSSSKDGIKTAWCLTRLGLAVFHSAFNGNNIKLDNFLPNAEKDRNCQ